MLHKFCFCIKLRTGCICMAIMGIIGRSWAGIGNGIGWLYIVPDIIPHPWRSVVSIANGILGIVASTCLLHGAMRNNRTTTKVYLFMVIVLIAFLCIAVTFGIVTICSEKWRTYYTTDGCHNDTDYTDCPKIVIWTIYSLALDTIDLCAYIYFWVCAYSFSHELKQLASTNHALVLSQYSNNHHPLFSGNNPS